MCGKIRKGAIYYRPGALLKINTKLGSEDKSWGINGFYNARSEKFKTIWNKYSNNRCILEVDEFVEKNGLFVLKQQSIIKLAGLYNEDQFTLLTRSANELVSKFHHRMPIVINGLESYWLNSENIKFSLFNEINDKKIILRT